MSLRARLALLYTSIVGGILFFFGMAVFMSVSFTLTKQVDSNLAAAADQLVQDLYADDLGLKPRDLDLFSDIYVQVWGRSGKLLSFSMNTQGLVRPIDELKITSSDPVYSDVRINNRHLRVLTVPLVVKGNRSRGVGTLQMAASMDVVDTTQRVLLWVLFVGAFGSMTVAGLAALVSTERALMPLEGVTQAALQITRADDLSRRIPYQGPPEDEVGQLITAFNKTLGRLENLFNTQRRFLTDVGHELRTPLTVIKGNVHLMRRMNCTDDESMQSIESEVDRLTRLVGDLLLLAQAESGKIPLANEIVELDTLVLEVMSQMRVLAKDRLQLRLGEIDQVLVCGDKDRLKQVLVNLVGNAIKYTPLGGEVVIGLGKVEHKARLTVTDNGPGIPAEDLPYIFERFYRGEKSRTRSRDGKGFGLGLSIAYWIVRNHGGQIDVSSLQPQGTNFCVWLPLAEDGCKEEPPALDAAGKI